MTKTPTQLDREVAAALTTSSASRRPLYGHASETSAFVVADYPYGFRERTQIRYWLEHKPKKGWRLVSQTMNPKTQRWNKPKASTYIEWGAALYLDDQDHVQWTGIGPYSDAGKILAFVNEFPGANMSELRKIVPAKLKYLSGMLSGDIVWTINKVPQPLTTADAERLRDESVIWEAIKRQLDRG